MAADNMPRERERPREPERARVTAAKYVFAASLSRSRSLAGLTRHTLTSKCLSARYFYALLAFAFSLQKRRTVVTYKG